MRHHKDMMLTGIGLEISGFKSTLSHEVQWIAFSHPPSNSLTILLGCCKAKIGTVARLKLQKINKIVVEHSQHLEEEDGVHVSL